MKIKRILSALTATAATISLMAITASAATVDLPLPPTAINNDNQKGWCVNGTDGVVTTLTLEEFQAIEKIVLEISQPLAGDVQIALQCDNGWAWDQTDAVAVAGDSIIEIDFKSLKGYDKLADTEEQAKFYIGYWGDGTGVFDDLGITKAYLVTSGGAAPAPAAPAEGGASPAPATGNTAVVTMVAIMAIAGVAAAASRKRK
jgi:hypothetical protein